MWVPEFCYEGLDTPIMVRTPSLLRVAQFLQFAVMRSAIHAPRHACTHTRTHTHTLHITHHTTPRSAHTTHHTAQVAQGTPMNPSAAQFAAMRSQSTHHITRTHAPHTTHYPTCTHTHTHCPYDTPHRSGRARNTRVPQRRAVRRHAECNGDSARDRPQ